ncbi:MAG: DNA/RNA non-specific endonuclease [Planctomycetes bacterium]|nr:DNA/RNA non-specific endonuclease [Planctomycetota bacterium]
MIGPTLDFARFPPTEAARRAGRPVARIVETPEPGTLPSGFGTGFLVAPRLLMTNHHVLPSKQDAIGVSANFLHEFTPGGLQMGVSFELDPELFFVTADKLLDCTIVGVKSVATTGESLDALGILPLIGSPGKILIGHPINIIQYPGGGPKQYATTQNQLLDILEEGFQQYTTDTLQGSSGSPASNRAWEVVGLHHSSIPRLQEGRILTKAGNAWKPGMPEDDIEWIANEAVRASHLVQWLALLKLDVERQRDLLAALLRLAADPLEGVPNRQPGSVDASLPTPFASSADYRKEPPMSQTVIYISGPTTIYVGQSPAPAPESRPMLPGPAAISDLEKKIRFDSRYGKRKGYDAGFLAGVEIPLPTVAKARKGEMYPGPDGEPLILKYHHFSLAMNATRRLQMWSAVNVDYSPELKSERERKEFGTDTWILDKRVPEEVQIQDDEFYKPATKIDRGHVVRREDNAWGKSELEIEYANSDTFHWTNCTPQHEAFNREMSHGLWGKFESHLQTQIGAVGHRASIFAGPVLDNVNDPEYDFGLGQVQYPLRFWKVIAAVSEAGGTRELVVNGFLFDQTGVIERLGLERIDFQKFTRYQRSLGKLTELTGVKFPDVLVQADALRDAPPNEERREIGTLGDVLTRKPRTDRR